MIKEPGIYTDITEAEYHADPCEHPSLSRSIAKIIINGPAVHAWTAHPRLNRDFEEKHSTAFDLGKAAHDIILSQPEKIYTIQAVDKNGEHVKDWRTKEAKKEREQARKDGNLPFLLHEYERLIKMVKSAKNQLYQHEDGKYFYHEDAQSEVTIVWNEDGYPCRIRVDRLVELEHRIIAFDYKTTGGNASSDKWNRVCFDTGADIQGGFYPRGLMSHFNKPVDFFFVVQETKPPYALNVMCLNGTSRQIAERKTERAIRNWIWCRQNGFYGYPSRTSYIEPPSWERMQWADNDHESYVHGDDDSEYFSQSINMQSPLKGEE